MNFMKVLGASGSKSKTTAPTCFQIYKDIIVDAGNVLRILGDDSLYINHIFLTHAHADHIVDIPFIIEGFFEQRKETLTIYALKETIDALRKHTFNNEIWPDFTKIPLLHDKKTPSLQYQEITLDETIQIRDYSFKPIYANHIPGSCGYVISKEQQSFIISGDTYINEKLIEEINTNPTVKSLIIECSFPNHMAQLAKDSKHLTPQLLASTLEQITKKNLQVFIYHIKPFYKELMLEQIHELDILNNGGKVIECGDVIHFHTGIVEACMLAEDKFERLIEINLSLSNELNKDKLFDMLLTLTRELTHADGGTLYIMSKNKRYLDFTVVQNDTLDTHLGGVNGEITWNSVPLYNENNEPNLTMVAAVSALESRIINIEDVYYDTTYNFEGTKQFDSNTGYRSKSMLVVPLINHEDDVIGVLQLINKSRHAHTIEGFDAGDERIVKALAAQVSMALNNTQLINSIDGFIAAFIDTIIHAIEAKSIHTKNHIVKVTKIARMLAHAIHKDDTIYKDITYSENDFRQIEVAAMMHDIGKVSMPEAVIDKSTKLETIADRIENIKERFEIILRDKKIAFLEGKLSQEEYEIVQKELEEHKAFIIESNKGGEFMDDKCIERLHQIAKISYFKDHQKTPLLSDDELYNLCIRRGTLTDEEKALMNSHAQLSFDMLSIIPFPKKYKDVLHIAANHHEKPNGKGYPRGLDASQICLEDRIMVLADIFEALTASDRPYKDGKKLSEVFKILSFMVKDGELDGDLVKFLHNHEILKQYAKEELNSSQIDESRLLFE